MIVPLGTDQIRLINFTESETDGLHRLGGRAPQGLEPQDKTSRYLMTIGLEEDLCVSIFLKDDVFFFIETCYTVFTAQDACVEAFFHKPVPRREDELYRSTFSGYSLALGSLQRDEVMLDKEIHSPHHDNKLGGGTYLINEEDRDMVETLESQGFHHLLQLDGSKLHSPGVKVIGEDPFGYGILHFYLKPLETHFDWCCFVESD